MNRLVQQAKVLWCSANESPLGTIYIAGHIRNSRGVSLSQMRTYGNYALVYLLKGSGRARFGKQAAVPCRAGDLLFIYPEIPQGYGPGPGEKWTEFTLSFRGPVFDLWRQSGLLNPEHPIIRLPQISRMLPQLKAVVDSRLPDTPGGMLRRVCRLQKFLGDILQERPAPHHPVAWLERATRKLMELPDQSPMAVARVLGLSYETFRKDFTRLMGTSPTRYRTLKRIEQARALLRESNMSNKEIAATLGFYDEFHFSRRFRQFTGENPRNFRHQLH